VRAKADEAFEVLSEALRRAPGRVEPVLNPAIAHARKGDKAQSRAFAREVLRQAPQGEKGLREQAERLLKTLG
jgi:hypothetical protein